MNEITHMDEMMCGIRPADFSNLDNDSRSGFDYTWDDLGFNLNSAPFRSDTAIVVTSYFGHLGYLKSVLSSYRKSGAFVILSYDNPTYIYDNIEDDVWIDRHFLRPIHYLLANCVLFKHKTYEADKRTGWFWDVKYAQTVINGFKNFKYVYVTNGDCIVEKPSGFTQLKEILGDGDVMSGQSDGTSIHTANMLLSISGFNRIMDYMTEKMRYPIIGSWSPEKMLKDAVMDLCLKEVVAPKQPISSDGSIDFYCKENADSTWKDVLGFKNLYHSFEYHENNSIEPPSYFKEYMDSYKDYIYFRTDWRETICMYWKTGDRRYLMDFWARGKDSEEDREYRPLEYYGKEPVYA